MPNLISPVIGSVIDPVVSYRIDAPVKGGGLPSLNSFMRGTNISGQDSGGSVFAFPVEDVFSYFVTDKKVKPVRLTFRHERMQPTPGGDLSSPYVDRYEGLVNFTLAKGGFPIIDPHNFGRYLVGSTFDDFSGPTGGTEAIIGQDAGYTSAQFADFWSKLATRFPNPRIMYNLMNEPHDQVTATLTTTLNAAIAAIRALGRRNLILVPFNGYSNRYGFVADAVAQKAHLNAIVDSASNWAIDYHCYVDAFSAGQTTDVQSDFMDDVEEFTTWARSVGKKAFVGEFGVADDAASMNAAFQFLKHLEDNKDVWIGFTWWTAVNYQDTYDYQLLPTELTDNAGPGPYTDRVQMNLLEKLFAASAAAPVFITDPVISGTPNVGSTLTAHYGAPTGYPIPTATGQWKRDGVAISGQTALTYVLAAEDSGADITFTSTATNESGSASATSNAIGPVISVTSFDSASKASTITLTNGDLTATGGGTSPRPAVRGNKGYSSGKYFHSVRSTGTATVNQATGLGMSTMVLGTDVEDHAKGIMAAGDGGTYGNSSLLGAGLGTWATNDVIDCAVDLTAKLVWFRRNGGNWNNNGSANPATGVGGISISYMTGTIYPVDRPWPNTTHTVNFGDTAYTYAAPSGFGNW